MAKFTLRDEMVKCGRKGCKSCPHGPYRYAYWSERGRTRKLYIGKIEKPPVERFDTDEHWNAHLADCAALKISALCLLLGKKQFVDARKRCRLAVAKLKLEGALLEAAQLRGLWKAAWPARR